VQVHSLPGSQYVPYNQQYETLQNARKLYSSVSASRSLKTRCGIHPGLIPRWNKNVVVTGIRIWGMEKLSAYGDMGSLNLGTGNSH